MAASGSASADLAAAVMFPFVDLARSNPGTALLAELPQHLDSTQSRSLLIAPAINCRARAAAEPEQIAFPRGSRG